MGSGFGEKSAFLGGSGGGVRSGFLLGKVEGVRESWRILGSKSALLGGMLLGEGRECFGGTGGGAGEPSFDTGDSFSGACGGATDEKDDLGISGSGWGMWRVGEDERLVGSADFLKYGLLGVEGRSVAVPLALVRSVEDFRPEDANCVSSSSPLLAPAPLDPLLPVFVLRVDEQSSRWRCSSLRPCSSFFELES